MTEVFVVNSGSSSIKYQLVNVETGEAIVNGLIERIGNPSNVEHLGRGTDTGGGARGRSGRAG